MVEAAGVRLPEALAQLGLRVRRARPRAAPGRPCAARGARREPRPLTFVNSLGLGDPASTDTIHRRLADHPNVHFKLDAATAWTLAVCEDLAATGAVEVVDFKGQYGMEVEDAPRSALYERVVAIFPDANLEDPHDLPEVAGPSPRTPAGLLRRADPHGRRPCDDAGEPDPDRQIKPAAPAACARCSALRAL